ncbi:MAG: efflux RND transporter permease subunit [Dysgonamonadaceae bacterium]|nr:efflux RND transporter permease subunit [Dysgonamonadaceae bacterium]
MSKKNSISSFTVIVAFISIALMGIALIPLLPVKLSPSRERPTLTVSFSMQNNSARIVEMEATSKLEAMLARMKGVKNIHSTSGNGWGRITLNLDKHTSIDVARFEASTIVRQTWPELPREVSYPSISVSRSDENAARPFMTFTLNSAATPFVIQQYAENNIKPQLSSIKGLYKIEVRGATPMEWQLEYDNDQMETLGVTLSDLREAVTRYYSTDFLGMAQTELKGDNRTWMRIMLVSDSEEQPFDATAISVKNRDGALIRLNQLIKVTRTEQKPTSYYRINGLNSIYISLTAEETANQLHLSKDVDDAIENIRNSLPQGYEIHNSYNATERIHAELNKIYLRSGLTVFILLLFVLIITRNVRYLFLITVTLAVNLFIAVIFYYLLRLEMQLYSLAGITISLSLIIDNVIIMTDHLMHKKDRRAFIPILAATITTVGALSIIFFLDEKIRLDLQDFAAVVMINLSVSLLVALFFVPAMVEKVKLKKRKPRFKFFSPRRMTIHFTRFYGKTITLLSKHKWIPFTGIVLLFGLPVFLIPDKIQKESFFANQYNKVFDNSTYKEKVKPIINKALGGTLRLFVDKVVVGSYFTRNDETVLSITATMPNGTTLPQMNSLIEKMERYLSGFSEIRQFQTNIDKARRASISVYFNKASERSGFPYQLKSSVISKAFELGGGSWSVYGLQDQGFSNDVREQAGQYRVKLYGYNYDELTAWADTLKNQLLTYRRIKEVLVNSNYSWYKDDYQEFSFDLNKQRLASEGILPGNLFASLSPIYAHDVPAGSIMIGGVSEAIKLNSKQAKSHDIWSLQQVSHNIGKKTYKLGEVAEITKTQAPQEVGKENQQYRLVVQYDYIGAHTQGNKILEREVELLNDRLPMGYTAQQESSGWGWGSKDNKQYWLIGLLIVIIFFTTSVLFNSIKQPLAVIFIIPVSFIGVFLTFYWFNLNFDQGGFASFILLSGITVNASIYILNEYNMIRKYRPLLSPMRAYLKAWNAKIVPIFLTVVSTILGFIPFMVGFNKEAFWFPLAAGTIGGLIMSMVGIFIFLPLLIIKRR